MHFRTRITPAFLHIKNVVARDAGLSRESLYKALSGERSPDCDTILKVVGALGLKLHAEAPRGRLRPSTSRPSSHPTKRRAA
ncbi:MAG: hypothetical protein SGJ26_07730 [Nitrospirota bacterium]|nr:hypothetical protein [Nitrospirota bacterium]